MFNFLIGCDRCSGSRLTISKNIFDDIACFITLFAVNEGDLVCTQL